MKKIENPFTVERKRGDLSQKAFAEQLGLSESWYNALEAGKVEAPIPSLRKLAAVSRASLGTLFLRYERYRLHLQRRDASDANNAGAGGVQ